MIRLTVFFKYKMIHSKSFENGIVYIGRNETNDLAIDSLAVAPIHAAIVTRDDGSSTITQLNDNFPLIINDEKIKECNLINNDMITIGKHNIIYNNTDSSDLNQQLQRLNNKDIKPLDQKIGAEPSMPAASLQVMDGENIGKLFPLKKAMTQLGNKGSGVVVISKRKDGYFISVLENAGNITLNKVLLNDSIAKLNQNDVVVINNTSLQFFQN